MILSSIITLPYIGIYLLLINIATFFTYGWDKYKSKHLKWRTSEATLLLLALVGGSVGAFLGIASFQHKTKQFKSTLGVPFILIIQLAFMSFFIFS